MERAAAKNAAISEVAPTAEPAPAESALDEEKAARIRAAMQKREEEKARLAAMSPEERAALEAEKAARIAAAKEKAAAKKAAQSEGTPE